MKLTNYRRNTLALSLALALFLPSAVVAQAQDAAQDDAENEAAEEATQDESDQDEAAEEATQLDTITVTGSRIQRAGFDTLEPATVVSAEYIRSRGITNVADALNEIPGFGVGVTPEGGQSSFGVGVNFVNRFGLGSNRTLTLINGRRFVSSNPPSLFGPAAPGIQVDLNVVPTSMVNRVENLAIGGAPTYGADAISGVVNIILKKNYEGTEVGTTYGVTSRGDNERHNAYALWGANFGENDRGNITLNISYDNVTGVLQKDREYFRNAYSFSGNPLASVMASVFPGRTPGNDGRWNPNVPFNTGPADGIPNSVLITNRHIWTTPFGGLITPITGPFRPGSSNLLPAGFGPGGNTVLAFNTQGQLVPYNPGSPFTAVDASGGDGLFLTEAGQITSDLERRSLFGTGRWSLTDNTEVFFEATHYYAESLELSDQWMYNSPLFGGLSAMIRFPASHPMLSAQARQTLASLGVSAFNLSKASRDLVTNNASGTTETNRLVSGFEGYFELGGRDFDWESTFNWGRTKANYYGTSLDQQNFVNSLHVVLNAAGQIVCSPTPVPGLVIPGGRAPVADPNCVPLDMFGDGRPSQAARDYVTEPTRAWSELEQKVFNINVSSTLLDLWSGPLLYNIGYEQRREFGEFQPGAFLEAGRGRAVPITPLAGSYSTDEFFGEFVLPLVSPDNNWTLLRKFDIVGKYRTVDNTINGRANTYTYGIQWKPLDELEVRGNFTRAIRAPAITELFLPQASSFQFVTGDPCDSRFINGGPNPAVRSQNCAAFLSHYGLSTFSSTAASASIQGVSGGNPNLLNESADSETFGFTWAPSFIDGLTLAADYYRIEISNVITSLTAAQLASACFDNPDFNPADVPNANSFCSAITRNAPGTSAPGQATTFRSGFTNGRFQNMESYSAEARYLLQTENHGDFSFSWIGYFPEELSLNVLGISTTESAGTIGTSSRQHQFNFGWDGRQWGTNLSANYVSGAQFNLLNTPETQDILAVDSHWLLNAGAYYAPTESVRVRLAVTNVFDEDPPFPTAGIGTYDILGRRYSLSLDWRF